MLFFISKLLPVFLYPVGMSGALALAGVAAIALRRYKSAVALVVLAVFVLWFCSVPATARLLVRPLERRFDPPETFTQADAIVLLGGGSVAPIPPRRYVETNQFGDRIPHAARLFHKGYAPHIVSTGGSIPFVKGYSGTEAQCMAALLIELYAVDSSRILLEPHARNTADHPGLVADVLAGAGLGKRILLVTSAMHMPRAMALFRKAGYTVTAAPCDYWVDARQARMVFSFLPDAAALQASTAALHEYYGIIAYRLLGKI